MTTARIELPPKLIPVFAGSYRYRIAWGGRGSGKTRSFALMTAIKAYQWSMEGREGIILCGREFMNSLEESSMEEIKAAIRSVPWLVTAFDIGDKYIRTLNKKVRFVFAGLRHNLDSIKSKARVLLMWVDEAENVSETAWQKAIPSIREAESEIWVTWNPERKNSATHKRFRENPPDNCIGVEVNYVDNPWFPDVLEQERLGDLKNRPDQYDHVWLGAFKTITEGAYYAKALALCKQEGRITDLGRDPLMAMRAFWDIGGTGQKADSTAIWIAQFVGEKIKVLAYYEAQGQDMATHVNWLRSSGFEHAEQYLPHDGAHGEKVFDTSYERALRQAGFNVRVVPNQGRGAAMQRVEAARRWFSRIWFNRDTTAEGVEALGAYHEKRHDLTGIGLGPNHDWSSHGADAFGLMCSTYEEPRAMSAIKLPKLGVV